MNESYAPLFIKQSRSEDPADIIWNECTQCRMDTLNEQFCSRKCVGLFARQKSLDKFARGLLSNVATISKILKEIHGPQCMSCRTNEWLGQPIPLEVDHIDGNASNNLPSNVRLICPNCHALTPTYKAKNRGSGRKSRGMIR